MNRLATLAALCLLFTASLAPVRVHAQEEQKEMIKMVRKTLSKTKKMKKHIPQQEHINDALKKKFTDGSEKARDLASFPKEKGKDDGAANDKSKPKVESWKFKQENLIDEEKAKKLLEE